MKVTAEKEGKKLAGLNIFQVKMLTFFFLSFFSQVQAEEISDEEWRQMMTDDLSRHGVLGQIVDTVPPYIVNVDYADHACVHMGNQLFPHQTKLQPDQVK